MNVQEYISSGILESYVLGSCNHQEASEVEYLMVEHVSIRDEISAIQETLELAAVTSEIPAPLHLKSEIWNKIQEEQVPVIPLNPEIHTSSNGRQWLAYAASFALIFGASSVAIFFYSQNRRIENQLAVVEKKHQRTQDSLGKIQSKLNLIADLGTKKVNLAGVPTSKNAKAVVFWNESKKQVLLTGIELPPAPSDKQYQLWALVDGVPVDAGVFENTATAQSMIEMKSIHKSQAFAITLEPKGGSASPHLDALCVIGNV